MRRMRTDNPRLTGRLMLLGTAVAMLAMSSVQERTWADDPPAAADGAPADPALDERLRNELDEALFEGLDEVPSEEMPADAPPVRPAEPEAAAETPAAEESPAAESEPEGAPTEGRPPGGAADEGPPSADAPPLVRAGQRMRQVERQLADRQVGSGTQEEQTRIVADLEELLKQLAQQQNRSSRSSSGQSSPGSQRSQVAQSRAQQQPEGGQPSGSSGQAPEGPAREATDRLGPDQVRRADPAEMRNLMKDLWGHLPPRVREQMLQASMEQFLPKYELLIEQYFKRLLEQQAPQR